MRIFLRSISEKDSAIIVKWRNSEKVRKHCMTKAPISIESHKQFYRDKIATGKYKQFIVERIEEESGLVSYPIATVYLKDMDMDNRRCELCVFTSNDIEWEAEGQILAIKMLLSKAFQEYGMHKVYSYVIYNINESLEILKSAGFTIESVLKSEALIDGSYSDIYRLCAFSYNDKLNNIK